MRYIIIEDERLPYEDLKRKMHRLRPDYELVGWATSVEQGRMMLREERADLLISDIRLGDGDSLQLMQETGCQVPVIFTTAYNEYTLRAFKLNSVDYLLKPIVEEELEAALEKLERNRARHFLPEDIGRLHADAHTAGARKRFAVQVGEAIQSIEDERVAAFYSVERYTVMHCFDGKQYTINHTLDQLEQSLDKDRFFRVSRSYIVHIRAVAKAVRWMKDGLKVKMTVEGLKETTVSRARKRAFLQWLGSA